MKFLFLITVVPLCIFGLMIYLVDIGVSEDRVWDILRLVGVLYFAVFWMAKYYMDVEVNLVKWRIIYFLVFLGCVLAIYSDKQTIYSALTPVYNVYQIPLFPLVIGVIIALYIPVTWIFWRRVYLFGWRKLLFCLTIYPIFIVLMVINILLTNWYAPWLYKFLDANEGFVNALIVFLFLTSVSVGLSFVWYKLISWFDTDLPDCPYPP